MLLQHQRHSPVGLIGSRTDEKDSNGASQQESHDRAIHENIPGASRKRKRVNQVNQHSKIQHITPLTLVNIVTLHPSDSDSYLSEDSTCQRKDSEDPLSKYSKVDSDVEVEGDQDNSYKDLASLQEDSGQPIDTKLADVLVRIWGKTTLGDSQKEELKNMLIPENCPLMKTPLLNPEIYKKVSDSATSRDKGAQQKQRILVKSTIPLVKAVVALKGLEHDAQDKFPRHI